MKKLALVALLVAAPLHAQSAGKTGAQVLQFNPGARAAALSGAYGAVRGDADALFYNPAAIAGSRRGASASYETHASGISFGSVAGFTRAGRLAIGASVAYLDEGSIHEITPDPLFSGNIGNETGATLSASETAARLSLAVPFNGNRLRVGASLGYVSVSVAEFSQNAPIADVGAQYDVAGITIAGALRNAGSSLSGPNGDPLPTEARLGVAAPFRLTSRFSVAAFADAIARVNESAFGAAGGIEAGLAPGSASAIGAVARVGIDSEAGQLGRLRIGAGITLRSVSLDYAYQNYRLAGAVHRMGLRWSLP